MTSTRLKVLPNSMVVVRFFEFGPLTVVIVVVVSEQTKGGTLGFVKVYTKGRP